MKHVLLINLLISITIIAFAQQSNKEAINNSELEQIDVVFKNFVLLELGDLPQSENEKTNELKLYEAYERAEEDWTKTLAAVLNFPEIIDVSIWDNWIKSSKYAKAIGLDYTTDQFADQFIEKFYSNDNKIEVLEGKQLEEAKQIIEEYKKELSTKSKSQ